MEPLVTTQNLQVYERRACTALQSSTSAADPQLPSTSQCESTTNNGCVRSVANPASVAKGTSSFVPSAHVIGPNSRIEYDMLPPASADDGLGPRGFVRIVYSRAGFKHEGFVPEAVLRSEIHASSERKRHATEASHFTNFKKQLKFLVSLAYNRMRYATWNEIFLFDDIAVASAVGGGVCAAHSSLDDAGGGVDLTGKTSTHVFLGQLPTVEHMHVLHRDLKVECVVSCVEEFELKKYDLNFGAMGFDHCILPQEDFGRMPPQLIHMGVNFLLQQDLGPSRKAYVHCKAGRGRSGAVVMAYIVARDMRLHEEEQRVLVTQQLSPARGSPPGGGVSAAAAAALSSKVSLASRSLALEAQSRRGSDVGVVRVNLLDAFLHMSRSRGHVSYKSKKMRDLHIYFLQQLASRCLTLRPRVDGEQWVDRATEAIMESIRCFKKWRKEAEMAGVEHKPLQPDKKDGSSDVQWFAPLPKRLPSSARQKILKAQAKYCAVRARYCELCSFEFFRFARTTNGESNSTGLVASSSSSSSSSPSGSSSSSLPEAAQRVSVDDATQGGAAAAAAANSNSVSNNGAAATGGRSRSFRSRKYPPPPPPPIVDEHDD